MSKNQVTKIEQEGNIWQSWYLININDQVRTEVSQIWDTAVYAKILVFSPILLSQHLFASSVIFRNKWVSLVFLDKTFTVYVRGII